MLAPWKKSYDKPRQCIKMQRHHLENKGLTFKHEKGKTAKLGSDGYKRVDTLKFIGVSNF